MATTISQAMANNSIPIHLHPVALRSTSNASSSRSAQASIVAEATLRGHAPSTIDAAIDLAHLPSPPPSPPTVPLPPLPDSSPSCSAACTPRLGQSPTLSPRFSSLGGGSSLSRPATIIRAKQPLPPVAGLRVDHSQFPLLSIRSHTPSPASWSDQGKGTDTFHLPQHVERQTKIRLINAAQYVDLYKAYLASAASVDESTVFPWLHCCDQTHTPQAAYFAGSFGNRGLIAPRYRGLTIVSADPEVGPQRRNVVAGGQQHPNHERARTQSLGSSSTTSSTSLESATSSLFDLHVSSHYSDNANSSGGEAVSPAASVSSFDGPEARASLLTSSHLPADILARCPRTGCLLAEFATPRLPPNVNLRLFKQQPARYASVSDVVVYADGGLCDEAVALAEMVQAAQELAFEERGGKECGAVQYATYIITDGFKEFERNWGEVVAVDGWGWRRNRIDFFEKEREEMCVLTRAGEIAHNVWLGNSNDVPLPAADEHSDHQVSTSDSSSSLATTLTTLDDGNVNAFGICIEAHDQAHMPSRDMLRSNEVHLSQVEAELALNGDSDLRPTVVEGTSKGERILRPHVSDMAHLEVISTGQVCASLAALGELVERMVEMCAWVERMTKPEGGNVLGKRVLVHCHDGYTESSLFALSYTMWSRRCSLPEAYLHLQLACERSFFVYPADVQLLQRIEQRIMHVHAERKARIEAERMDIDEAEPMPVPLPPPSRSGLFKGRVPFGLVSKSASASPVTSSSLIPGSPPMPTPSPKELHPWFYDDRFDGHFPSRILPFVYLGNLNHALNALMLKELGITHVVSMGESALVQPKNPTFPLLSSQGRSRQSSGSNGVNVQNSLWHEHKGGRIQVLDMKNVADDGIDSIRPHIDRSVAFIEECRQSGGKVLVHCRVGVSRSATIVIAYVMQYLRMDLASTYLMVRSRRLNILIQPNLLFMWALRRLEADLVEREQDPIRKVEWQAKMLSWSHFSSEVAGLNARYLV